MNTFENNAATILVEDKFFRYDFENEEFPGKADMEEKDTASTFCEYVHIHAVRCGYTGGTEDTDVLASFVAHKCSEAGIKLGSGTKTTVNRWLTQGLPGNNASSRENVYLLCFALQMNAQQTKEFFLKAYLERPFNYKDIREAVYFFCLNNGLPYTDAVRIISEIEATDVVPNPYADNITEQIGDRLSEFTTEDEFLRYITENRSGFSIQNQSATQKIKELRDSCMKVAPKEYAISTIYDKEIKVNNIDELLSVIYGYSARATEKEKPIYKKSISKSNFPKLIKQNWPDRERFAQILEKENGSYDVIRRALIMLNFYDFFAKAIVAEKEAEEKRRKTGQTTNVPIVAEGLFDEFTDEMNTVLAECGYVQLYWRNPFDWMIGYCAMSPDPIRTLRELIIEYYLSDPDVIDQ